ncbi:hypothetical protein pb186bvf_015467 [Paramecium bursaria]
MQQWNDQLIQLIRDRKQQLSQFVDVLQNDKYYADCVQISKNVDKLVERSDLDVQLFLKRILIFGMVIYNILDIRNSLEKLDSFYKMCKLFKEYVPSRMQNKDIVKYIIQSAIPESKMKVVNDFQMVYESMIFPQNLSFKSVVTRLCQVLDVKYLIDSIFLGNESQNLIQRSDSILTQTIIEPIRIFIETISLLQFEDETSIILQ